MTRNADFKGTPLFDV